MRMRDIMTLVESIEAVHRTSASAAAEIKAHGFGLQNFGQGAGAGTGEPAGVFVSLDQGEDFANENQKRRLGLNAVLHLRLNVQSVLDWQDRDERLAFTKAARMEFLRSRFGLSDEDATAVFRFMVRVLKARPDLYKIAEWLNTREGEREESLFLSQKLRDQGYDAVAYRDPWQGVQQMIVLDPSKIEVKDISYET